MAAHPCFSAAAVPAGAPQTSFEVYSMDGNHIPLLPPILCFPWSSRSQRHVLRVGINHRDLVRCLMAWDEVVLAVAAAAAVVAVDDGWMRHPPRSLSLYWPRQ